MAYEISEQKKIGLGLVGFGILFSFLGMILFFDRGLLALGNIFWLAGVGLLLGLRSTLQLFTNRTNYKILTSVGLLDSLLCLFWASFLVPRFHWHYKGSVSFLLGIFLIFVRWPIVGMVMELYGCIVLFGGFWPSIKVFLYQIPVFGWLLQYPALLLDRLRGSSS